MGSNWLGSWTANSGGVAHLGEHIPCTDKVAGSIPVASTRASVAQLVERNLAKVEVAGSNPVSRSNFLAICP